MIIIHNEIEARASITLEPQSRSSQKIKLLNCYEARAS